MRLISLAAAAALLLASPALAQTPAPAAAPEAAAAAGPQSPAEIALQADAEAFQARMQAMTDEISAAMQAGRGDSARITADVELVLGRYEPEIGGFADRVQAFLTAESAASTDERRKAALAAAAAEASTSIRSIPVQVRTSVQQAVLADAAAPAAQ